MIELLNSAFGNNGKRCAFISMVNMSHHNTSSDCRDRQRVEPVVFERKKKLVTLLASLVRFLALEHHAAIEHSTFLAALIPLSSSI